MKNVCVIASEPGSRKGLFAKSTFVLTFAYLLRNLYDRGKPISNPMAFRIDLSIARKSRRL